MLRPAQGHAPERARHPHLGMAKEGGRRLVVGVAAQLIFLAVQVHQLLL